MTVCANRPETPGFWTPCHKCPCGAAVRAEVEAAKVAEAGEVATQALTRGEVDQNHTDVVLGRQIEGERR